MTNLDSFTLVSKTHDRIIFRGALDTLQAEVLEAQILAQSLGEKWYCETLGEILAVLRNIMKAEVTGSGPEPFSLFNLGADEIRRQSHHIKETFHMSEIPVPDCSLGPLAVRINYLRTRTREAEIAAIRAFEKEIDASRSCAGNDIVTALNRLSSAFWWLFCRYVNSAKTGR